MSIKREAKEVHIHEGADDGRQFVFHPNDRDLLMRTGRQVIDSCRLGISLEVWVEECRTMCEMVAKWAGLHRNLVRACYATARPSGIALFFVPESESFDFDLADKLVELSRKAQEFNVGLVDIYQVPQSELSRFISKEDYCQVYVDASGPHQSVEA